LVSSNLSGTSQNFLKKKGDAVALRAEGEKEERRKTGAKRKGEKEKKRRWR